jgi:hypothetical protein
MVKAPGTRKQRTDKGKPRGSRTVKAIGNGGDGRVLAADDNRDQNAVRENWHHHRKWWKAHHLRQALLDEQYRNGVKALKADGHAIESMRVADALESVKHAAKVEQQINLRLTVAWYLGLPMGAQLDLFQNPPHVDTTDDMQAEPVLIGIRPLEGTEQAAEAGEHGESGGEFEAEL